MQPPSGPPTTYGPGGLQVRGQRNQETVNRAQRLHNQDGSPCSSGRLPHPQRDERADAPERSEGLNDRTCSEFL